MVAIPRENAKRSRYIFRWQPLKRQISWLGAVIFILTLFIIRDRVNKSLQNHKKNSNYRMVAASQQFNLANACLKLVTFSLVHSLLHLAIKLLFLLENCHSITTKRTSAQTKLAIIKLPILAMLQSKSVWFFVWCANIRSLWFQGFLITILFVFFF